MKSLLIPLSLAVVVALPVAAETRVELRTDVAGIRASTSAQIKVERENERNQIGEARLEFRGKVVTNRVNVATRVFDATIARLNKIIDRINSRIAKVKAAGGTTADAEAQVALAKTSIASAQAHVNTIKGIDVSSTGTSTTTAMAAFNTLKAEVKAARQDLQSAKQDLMKAVELLARQNVGIHASTTATVKTND